MMKLHVRSDLDINELASAMTIIVVGVLEILGNSHQAWYDTSEYPWKSGVA